MVLQEFRAVCFELSWAELLTFAALADGLPSLPWQPLFWLDGCGSHCGDCGPGVSPTIWCRQLNESFCSADGYLGFFAVCLYTALLVETDKCYCLTLSILGNVNSIGDLGVCYLGLVSSRISGWNFVSSFEYFAVSCGEVGSFAEAW